METTRSSRRAPSARTIISRLKLLAEAIDCSQIDSTWMTSPAARSDCEVLRDRLKRDLAKVPEEKGSELARVHRLGMTLLVRYRAALFADLTRASPCWSGGFNRCL